jgi:hypothetical protein
MRDNRLLALGGIVFAVLTFAGMMMVSGGIAGGETTTADATEWLADGGNRTLGVMGGYLVAAGALAFLVFLAATADRMRLAGVRPLAIEVARLFGGAFAVMQLAAAAALLSAPLAIEFDTESMPADSSVARLSALGIALWLVPGMLAAAAFASAVAVSTFTDRVFPSWVGLAGLLCAVALLAAVVFLPAMLFLLWTLVVSLVALARKSPAAQPQALGSPA